MRWGEHGDHAELEYTEFAEESNTERRVAMADALNAAAPCQQRRVWPKLTTRIKDSQKQMAKMKPVPAGVCL